MEMSLALLTKHWSNTQCKSGLRTPGALAGRGNLDRGFRSDLS
jgi:hypothetical protein